MVKIDAIWSKRTRYGQKRTQNGQNTSQSQMYESANEYHFMYHLIFIHSFLFFFNQNNLKVPRARLFLPTKYFTRNI
jgi:hypothetical protein